MIAELSSTAQSTRHRFGFIAFRLDETVIPLPRSKSSSSLSPPITERLLKRHNETIINITRLLTDRFVLFFLSNLTGNAKKDQNECFLRLPALVLKGELIEQSHTS